MNEDSLYKIRHSLAHVLAMAVLEVFPDAKLAIGPPVDNGFYYDFDLPRSLQPDDLPDLETRMKRLLAEGLTFVHSNHNIAEARERFKDQPYKLELINDLEAAGETEVSFYESGSFTDLCKGPHVASTAEIPADAFSLSHIAGAYWKGSEKNKMLQRIYGLAFGSKEALDAYVAQQEEARKRDHRVLGPQLGIFMQSDAVGAGLPLWLPKGETVKHVLSEYMRDLEESLGYQYVSTPVLAHETLYQRSGHAQYYSEDMYSFVDDENNRFYLAPMNCPHHHMVMERLVTSYRDLPLKLAEGKGLYRKELSGTLTGLIRVRGAITMNDSHIYVTKDQLKEQFLEVLQLFKRVYEDMGINGYWFRLSLPDFSTTKYGGEQPLWEEASQVIREALQEFGWPYVEATGEAAFYGPKLDVQIRNVTGKEDTIATSQVDILVPKRMGLKYVDQNGEEQVPIVIHRAILGSYERFIAFLLEQTAGNLPFWLAPVQIGILPVSDQFIDAAKDLAKDLRAAGLRVELDSSTESVGKKIRNASLQKLPAKIVLGQQEVDEKEQKGEWNLKLNWRSDYESQGEEPEGLAKLIERLKTLK